jgi:predicted MFS family arabinose efflux permease
MEARPVRDRPTWITYLQMGCYAWFMYAFGATLALLRDEQGTSRSVSSLHGSLMALGGLAGGLLSARAIDRWGRGRVIRIAAIATAAGILIYTAPSAAIVVTMPGILFAGFAGAFLLIAMNAFLLDHQGDAGPASLTEANAVSSLAGLLGPIAVGIGAATFLGWRFGLWLVIIGFVVVEVWRGRNLSVFGEPGGVATHSESGHLPRRIYWTLAVIMCFIAAEFSLTFWGADLLRERCNFGPAAAAASLGAVTGGMLIGRVFGSRFAQRFNTERILQGSIVLALLGFILSWSFTLWPLVISGMLVTGIGIGVHWPLGVARAVRASGGLTDHASAAASVAASAAIAIAPFALGALSDVIGFHEAFLLVPAFLVVALVLMIVRPVPDQVGAARVVSILE